jgi:hypothetical protein
MKGGAVEARCASPSKTSQKTMCFGEINTSALVFPGLFRAKMHAQQSERQKLSTNFWVRSFFRLKRRIF